MAFVERVGGALTVSPDKRSPWYGIFCALAGAIAASIVWTIAIASAHLSDDQLADFELDATNLDIVIVDENQPQVSGLLHAAWNVNYDVAAGSGIHCEAIEPGRLELPTPCDDSCLPLHQRDDYRVEAPDILRIDFQSEDDSWQPACREYLVQPDGVVELPHGIGTVTVEGLTIAEIQSAIAKRLQGEDPPRVCASVFAQNSHVYYVIRDNAQGKGPVIYRMPVVGNETVFDAVSRLGDLDSMHEKQIFISRPQPGTEYGTVLPVHWQEISSNPSSITNYAIRPGDRIFVRPDERSVLTSAIGGLIEPFAKVLGLGNSEGDDNCPDRGNACPEKCCEEKCCEERCSDEQCCEEQGSPNEEP